MNKSLLTYVFGGVALALLVFVGYQNYDPSQIKSNGDAGEIIPMEEVGEYTVDFIKENLINVPMEFEILEVKEENGLYEIKFAMLNNGETQEDTGYVTKNGKYLFFQPFTMIIPEPQAFNKTDKPIVDLYVMSFCPFGNQAEELMMPVVELLGDSVEVELHYIVYNNYQSGYPEYCLDQGNKYCSMHGIQELSQGIRELCVQKYQRDKFWSFVKAINDNSDYENVDSKWEGIAQGIGINVSQIKTCEQDEGMTLLSEELALTEQEYPVQDPARHKGNASTEISGSPTMTVNGMIFDGQRSADGYKEAICSAMTNPIPECDEVIEAEDSADPGSCG
ncbi:MAG: hypothetical protein U9Q96_03025 [Patescibacteria group bacterium]|nr:hypothetical protein [Patescibacteria group bacterium]